MGVEVVKDICEILVSGIGDLGSGIATSVNAFLKNLMLEYTTVEGISTYSGLSTFGSIVVAFAAVSLAIGITKMIYLFVKSLGSRG